MEHKDYGKKRYIIAFLFLIIFLAALTLAALMTGSVTIPAGDVLSMLTGPVHDETSFTIIYNIRLPRIAAAILMGGGLALSGYLLQTFFSNPLAGPFVLGISSGAKLTVALTMIFMLGQGINISSMQMVAAAFAGAMAVMGFVLVVSLRVRNMSVLIICGIMAGYICSAVTDLVITFADDSNIVNLHTWSMGSLSGISWQDIKIISVIIPCCLIVSVFMGKMMGAYRLGETYAKSMGVNIRLLRVMLILVSSLLAACVTAFAGPISFIGIAIPHLMKNLFRTSRPHIMIFASFLGGAAATLLCDTIARTLFAPTEVSISSVTAVIFVPVVIHLMIKGSKRL
ncbi:MAG: iron ABC transporter permease [Lachnospiraceae bacterium]|nr:iron ABC transporter permease [Lachnospiraceae bacterium]